MAEHFALVLAAGGSRRLGRPKQLLRRDGETLVHRAARLALATQPRRLLVVLGARADDVRAALRDLSCEFVFNPEWEQGLSTSVRAAVTALPTDAGAVLILGCDQPELQASHLAALLALAADSPCGCAATVHGSALGTPAVVAPAVLRAATLRGDCGLGPVLTQLAAVGRLAADELTRDLDCEEDVRGAIARGVLDDEP